MKFVLFYPTISLLDIFQRRVYTYVLILYRFTRRFNRAHVKIVSTSRVCLQLKISSIDIGVVNNRRELHNSKTNFSRRSDENAIFGLSLNELVRLSTIVTVRSIDYLVPCRPMVRDYLILQIDLYTKAVLNSTRSLETTFENVSRLLI